MNKSASVVIIGGGISGNAIAYELAKRGQKDIVLLEKKFLTAGSTGRCGAGIRMQWGTKLNCIMSKYSVERYEHLNEELDYEHDIEFKQGGYLMCAATSKEMEQFALNVKLQNSLGIPSRMITPQEALEIIPYINTDYMIGGAFCQKDGHLNPFHTTQAFANAAQRLGVCIEKFTTVTGIDVDNGKVIGVQTDKGYIATNVVVDCAGGYSQYIAKMAGIDLPLYSQRHQILVTEPVEPLQGPMFMGFAHNIYCQQSPHGSFIMGRGDDEEPKDGRITSGWTFLEEMAKNCVKLLPLLKDLTVVRQWSGLYNMSPDKQPIYGHAPNVEGFYMASGFSGHGFMFGPVTGVVMAEMILGLSPTVDASQLCFDRFEKGQLFIEPSVV
ncbi:MAG: FAD-binding oxidoreductase [Clostridia bacterium]|nr:FAD-binding oxidoreductase [Clostridia bacterium]